jgi:branched-chain amino acid transport system substrate-binding protein
MARAVVHVLRERGFRAGEHRVGYQSCNDSISSVTDPGLCRRNARAFVATGDVVGVVGPWNSTCAIEQIPIVSRDDAGPLAMVSPSNTFEGLTRPPFARSLYPDGTRSYVRVVALNDAQGGAAAYLAKQRGARRVAVLSQPSGGEYASSLARAFRATSRRLGLEPATFEWTIQDDYSGLAAAVAATSPGLVFLAGLTHENAGRLVSDLRRALPAGVLLVGPDSFALEEIAEELGPPGDGLLATAVGIPTEALPSAGQRFLRDFGEAQDAPVFLGAPEAAQATEVLLDAIARSDGSRAAVVDELFATKVEDGILGSFSFDRFGDIAPAPIGVYRYERGKLVVDGVVRPPAGASD